MTDKEMNHTVLSVLTEEQETQLSSEVKKLQAFSMRLKAKKLLMSHRNSTSHKLWVNVKIESKTFWVIIDSDTSENFLHEFVIKKLELETQKQLSF